MKKYRIGIIGTSEIAFRRFLPALQKSEHWEFAGVASRDIAKTASFTDAFGGRGYASYDEIIADSDIDAIYLPLPPALHFEWGKKVLQSGKHLFLEKPSTIAYRDTAELVELAEKNDLALRENYMFIEHGQLKVVDDIIKNNKIGETRLIRATFTFPKRAATDFRYNKALGGGALLDCGGYPIKVVSHFLGEATDCKAAKLYYDKAFGVDLYGNAVMESDSMTAQIAFGMDNSYKCELEIYGQRGYVKSPRVFTANVDTEVVLELEENGTKQTIKVAPEDQFYSSILRFEKCLDDASFRKREYQELLLQAKLIDQVMKKGS